MGAAFCCCPVEEDYAQRNVSYLSVPGRPFNDTEAQKKGNQGFALH